MNFKFFSIFILTTLITLNPSIRQPFAKTAKTNHKSNKTRITSDFIDIKRKSQKIEFIDNVVVKNGPDMMTSNKMIVYYEDKKESKKAKKQKKSNKEQKNSIEKIMSHGNVKVFSAEFVATSDSGYYNPKKSLFILEKNVVVNNSDSIGTGEKFIYNLNTRKGKFVGANKKNKAKDDDRVIIIINKDAKKRSKNNQK